MTREQTRADNAAHRARWAKAIRDGYRHSPESIINVGVVLRAAKARMGHRQFSIMLNNEKLPFSPQDARSLMVIASNVRLFRAVQLFTKAEQKPAG